jgi:hypothetical protein
MRFGPPVYDKPSLTLLWELRSPPIEVLPPSHCPCNKFSLDPLGDHVYTDAATLRRSMTCKVLFIMNR